MYSLPCPSLHRRGTQPTHPTDVLPAALPHGRLHKLVDVPQGVKHGRHEVHDDGDLSDGAEAPGDVGKHAQLAENILGVGGLAAPASEALPQLLLELLGGDVEVELEGRALFLARGNDGLASSRTARTRREDEKGYVEVLSHR